MDTLFHYLDHIDDFVWSYICFPLIVLVGLYFSFASNWMQVKEFPRIVRSFFSYLTQKSSTESASSQGVHPLKASFACIGASVGIGNVVSITTAIEIGGPGALFWIWMTAIVGSLVKYAEVCLGMRFRIHTNNEGGTTFQGGPMYYLRQAFSSAWGSLAVKLFCVLMVFYGVEILQFHVVAVSVSNNLDVPRLFVALALLMLILFSESGGIARIGAICSTIIPSFIVIYLIMGLYVLAMNVQNIPQVFSDIFQYAFTPAAAIGGFAGSSVMTAISQGIRRSCYSSDIGVGYASIIHSASRETDPAKQASLTIVEVFIDIFVMCSMSVAIVMATGVWKGGFGSVMLVQTALSQYFPYMHFFMPFFLFLLGYTTIITYYFAGMKTAQFLFPRTGKILYYAYSSCVFLYFTFQDLTKATTAMSLVLAGLLLLNMVAIWRLRKLVCFTTDGSKLETSMLEPQSS